MNAKSLFVVGSMALMGAVFTSCSKDIAFDGEAVSQQKISEYQANFVKKYGPVDPNQTWDFSDSTPISYLSDGPGATRSAGAASSPITATRSDGTLTVDNAFLTWMHDYMKPGNDNAVKGIPFKFLIPNHPFTIVPIFQGKASYYWELWMHVGTVGDGANQLDEKIWSKGEDLKYRKVTNGDWFNAGTGEDGTKDAVEVEAPTFTFAFEDIHVGRTMFFYLKVWGNKAKYDADVTKTNCSIMSSTDKQMLALEVDDAHIPANLPLGQDVHIIGCEDSPIEGNNNIDRDYEDLAFLTDGLEITDVDFIDRHVTKRFMIEDLGSVDDFDFNDIVVDIVETWTEQINYEYKANGSWTISSVEALENTRHQEAIIRAMGGTINFHLFIGGKEIYQKDGHTEYAVTDMLNTGWGNTPINNYAEYAVIKNCELNEDGTVKEGTKQWTFANNNISVLVEEIGQNGEIYNTEVKFPKQGDIPMIIATSTNKLGAQEFWMKERVSISKDWFYIPGEE